MGSRIAIGNQTSFTAPTALFPFEYALARGFDAFEWFPDTTPEGHGFSEEKLDAARRRDVRNLALARGVRQSVHAPWWINPIMDESQKRLRSSVAFARDVGATLVNIHAGPHDEIDAYTDALLPLIDELHGAGLRLAIENTVESTPDLINALFARLRSRAGDAFGSVGLCFDMGHANVCTATQNDYLSFLDRLEPDVSLIHVHAHENWGDRDSHLPLFTGPAGENTDGVKGLVRRLLARRYDGAIILEQWPTPPEMLDNARDRMLTILEAGAASPDGEI